MEGLVWAGARSGPVTSDVDPAADILVLTAQLRAPSGWGELRGGRFVVATGAVRPVQMDGALVVARAPWGGAVEVFGGAPVAPRLGAANAFASVERPAKSTPYHLYDWLAGGRVSEALPLSGTLGASYVQERLHADVAHEEAGLDFALAPTRAVDFAARGAYDLTSPGIADALASLGLRRDPVRVEIFGTHRSPSRLLPATSLFSVLGDFPSETTGTTVRWFVAPRLDVVGSAAVMAIGAHGTREVGGQGSLRGLLRTDDRGEGSIGAELRRQDVSDVAWSGARVIAGVPLGMRFRASTELELAAPDHPRGRGSVWPWGLVALAFRHPSGWEAASAVEAASTPEHAFMMNALVRVSRALEVR